MRLETSAKERFSRIKRIIHTLEQSEASYVQEVHKNFDALDMNAIETLALKRKNKQILKQKLEQFLEKYQHADR